MHVVAQRIELRLRDVHSLKEKRHIVKSIIADLTDRFGLAAAEVDDLEKWQKTTIGLAVVSGSPTHAMRIFSSVARYLDVRADAEVLRTVTSYLEESE